MLTRRRRGSAEPGVRGAAIRREMADLDPHRDHAELARRSMVTLHGSEPLVYALFTVAFMKQVAVPSMARILYRRGTGDIVTQTIKRNDDTIVFFGHLLDHGPGSDVGRAWIERMNAIHAHFPIRNADSVYTLSTLALDPHELTAALGASPFSDAEREAHWRFWRDVAERQHLTDLPGTAEELREWALAYEAAEYAPTDDGRRIAEALIKAFGERCLPRPLRPLAPRVLSAFSPPRLRRVHNLPEPGYAIDLLVRASLRVYVRTVDLRRVPVDRSLAATFGSDRYGLRPPADVGYQRATTRRGLRLPGGAEE